MKKIYIDFDGVIMDTIMHSYQMLEDLGIDRSDADGCMNFYKTLDWDILLERSNEINDSFNVLNKLVEEKRCNVSILTHINSLEESIAKINLINERVNNIDIIVVPKSINKADMVNPTDAILVDDFIGNLEYWEEKGGIPIRFSLKKENNQFKVISDLKELFELL